MNAETVTLGKLFQGQGAPICTQGGRLFITLEEDYRKTRSVKILDASSVSRQQRRTDALIRGEA